MQEVEPLRGFVVNRFLDRLGMTGSYRYARSVLSVILSSRIRSTPLRINSVEGSIETTSALAAGGSH